MLASASGDETVRLWDTLPPAERYARALRARELEDRVRGRVVDLLRELEDPAAVRDAIREEWKDDPELRRAALRVLARSP
jgi:hypothetical protein